MADLLISGRVLAFWMLVFLSILFIVGIELIRRGYPVKIRKMAGLDALGEMIGRAAEMGKSVHYVTGLGSLTSSEAPQLLAGITILGTVTRLAAKYDVPVVYNSYLPEVMPLATEVMRDAYTAEGKLSQFNPEESVRFVSSIDFAYYTGVMAYAERARPAVNIMIGPVYAEAMMFAETFHRVGSIQLAGTARASQIPVFAILCDHLLIGEEIFAAAAYQSKDPTQLGSIWTEDVGKIVAVALILIPIILAVFGDKTLLALLKI